MASRKRTTSGYALGTSRPMTLLPGMGASMRTDPTAMARARSSERLAKRLIFSPGAGSTSKRVTVGPRTRHHPPVEAEVGERLVDLLDAVLALHLCLVPVVATTLGGVSRSAGGPGSRWRQRRMGRCSPALAGAPLTAASPPRQRLLHRPGDAGTGVAAAPATRLAEPRPRPTRCSLPPDQPSRSSSVAPTCDSKPVSAIASLTEGLHPVGVGRFLRRHSPS